MGEIKSTLELAMEKVGKIEVSPEEKERFKREEYISKARGVYNRYINGKLNTSGLKKELEGYEGTQRNMIIEALVTEMVDAIDISIDNKRLLEGIEVIKETDVSPLLDKIRFVCNEFSEEREKLYKRVKEEFHHRLEEMKISGTAVEPNVGSHELLQSRLQDLASQFEERIMKLKKELEAG